jgi:error-prone DNA polymerase
MTQDYIELHAHSYYSLLDGVPSPEALVRHAAELGMPALALTDHDALYGAPRFAQAAQQAGIRPIFGAELTLTDGDGHLTLLAEDQTGYANLCRIITLARHDHLKGVAALPWRQLADHARGLIALSGCRRSQITRALQERDVETAQRVTERFAAIFGPDRFFLELQRHHLRGDRRLNEEMAGLGRRLGLRLVATGNVHYLTTEQAPLHDIVTCIRHRVPLERANGLLRTNAEYLLRSPAEMATLFTEWPDALRTTLEIAERCQARLPPGPQPLPAPADWRCLTSHPDSLSTERSGWKGEAALPLLRPGDEANEQLHRLCLEGLARKVADGMATREYRCALERELNLIAAQGLAEYFLVVWDLVHFARTSGILCQGRGSAANSLVAYLLDVTPIDPLATGLVFERFLSPERATPPDIDLDFAAARREEAIQYLYRRYGHEHVAMACTVVTFGARQAVRDVGMALGFPEDVLDRVSANIDSHAAAGLPTMDSLRAAFGDQLDAPRWKQLLALAAALDGIPRHLGIHNGGMVFSRVPLAECIPIEPATMEERTVVQWDKDALEMVGWIKLDVLGLRMLSAISDSCDIIARQTGRRPDLSALRLDDPQVYAMLRRGETVGVFQVESRAQASLIPRFQTRCFADLTIQIALIRPGPIQGNMVHPYLRRRDGTEPVRYLHPLLEPALAETLGVILFQEQVLKVARDLTGFTPGEGELLRRALGHKRAGEQIETLRTRFLAGAQAKGVPLAVAEGVFEQLKAFGGYSFSKAHAAAFAVISYWSAWLRCYHPAPFFAGLLRHQPMGFYPSHVVVSDARRAGVKFLAADLRHSEANVSVEGETIRLGLNYVHGLGPQHIELLEDERRRAPFTSLADLVQRSGLERRQVESLVLAGALDYLGERRQLLWDIAEAYHMARRPAELPLTSRDERVRLRPMDARTRMAMTFAATGVSLDAHLTTLRRDAFTRAGARSIAGLAQMQDGQRVRIGGMIAARQRPPTAKGVCFLAVEDPDGIANVVVLPEVYARCRQAVRGAFVLVDGMVQRDHGSIHVVAHTVREI